MSCVKHNCIRPRFEDGLCAPCWHLARFFGYDPHNEVLAAADPQFEVELHAWLGEGA